MRHLDRQNLYALWETCFGDSPKFMQWFFENRFYPAFSACAEEGGQILSAAHGCPMPVNIRGRIINAVMIAGIGTHPSARGKGAMRKTLEFLMQRLRDYGFTLALYTPADFEIYKGFLHYATSDCVIAEANAGSADGAGAEFFENVRSCDPQQISSELCACYTKHIALRCSGAAVRSVADFKLKMADYQSDGAQVIYLQTQCSAVSGINAVDINSGAAGDIKSDAVDDINSGVASGVNSGAAGDINGGAAGYIVYYNQPDKIYAPEAVFDGKNTARQLLGALKALAGGKPVSVKLAPDFEVTADGYSFNRMQKSISFPLDAAKLLKELALDGDAVFLLSDGLIPQNRGLFRLNGEIAPDSERSRALEIDCGRLMQWLSGYRTLKQLAQGGHVTGYSDSRHLELSQKHGTLPCYIVDEY